MTLVRAAVVSLIAASSMLSTVPQATENLDEAKRLYNEGRFAVALARLQSLLLRLEGDPTPEARAIREETYLYSGLVYIALDDPEAARSAFRAMLRLAPSRKFDARVFAPKVVEALEAARRELAEGVPAGEPAGPTPGASVKLPSAREPKGPSRAKWTLIGAGAGGGAAGSAWFLTRPETTTTAAPQLVEVDLRVNGLKRGAFACGQELAFTVDVTNNASQIVRAQAFDLNFMSATTQCVSHRAEVDGTVNLDVQPGARLQVRRVDLQGDVCVGPGRTPGCVWRVVLVMMTSLGTFQDEIQFETVR